MGKGMPTKQWITKSLENLPRKDSEKAEIIRFWKVFYDNIVPNIKPSDEHSNTKSEKYKLGKRFRSPLRWQQVFGTGSAILAAFLALAGAAWSLDLTDLLYFNLLGAIYWLFIYLYLYIEIRWWVYERTKEWINNTWLIQKINNAGGGGKDR